MNEPKGKGGVQIDIPQITMTLRRRPVKSEESTWGKRSCTNRHLTNTEASWR